MSNILFHFKRRLSDGDTTTQAAWYLSYLIIIKMGTVNTSIVLYSYWKRPIFNDGEVIVVSPSDSRRLKWNPQYTGKLL